MHYRKKRGLLMEETREIDIDLRKIFYMMRTKVVYIILSTLLLAVAAGCFTHFFIAPTYSASILCNVKNNTDNSVSENISQDNISASQQLVNTYMGLLESDRVMDKVAEELGMNESGNAVRKMVTCTWREDTTLFDVTVSSTKPELAAKIANTIAKIAPNEIEDIAMGGTLKIVDVAKVPSSPSAPNTKKNILIGALAGFVISFLGFFIYEMFDTTITNAKDLERDFEIPVLGTIPRLESVERTADNDDNSSFPSPEPPKPSAAVRPSSELLENIHSMKGDAKNDK